jgi:hypothetical protein
MALDWWAGGAFAGGDSVPSGRIKAVQLALAQVRARPAQSDKPDRNGFYILRHGVADRPHHAGIGQGPIAAQMAAQCDQLLDRAAPARAQARIDEGSVLEVSGMGFVAELWRFIRVRKKFWLLPILIMMVAFGGLVLLTKGSAVAPFIYTLF